MEFQLRQVKARIEELGHHKVKIYELDKADMLTARKLILKIKAADPDKRYEEYRDLLDNVVYPFVCRLREKLEPYLGP